MTTDRDDARLRARLTALASAVPMEGQRLTSAGAPGRPDRPTVRTTAASGTAGLLGLLVVVLAGSAWLVGQPSGPLGDGVTGSARDGDYELLISVDRASYRVGEPITATATLTYRGALDSVTIGDNGYPIVFGVEQVDGTLSVEPGGRQPCNGHTLVRDRPFEAAFSKSGLWIGSDPDASFKTSYFADPLLRLPAGTWRIFAEGWFDEGSCGGARHQFQASVVVTVSAAQASASTSAPTPAPPGTATASLAPTSSTTSDTADTIAFWDERRGVSGVATTAADGSETGKVLVTADGGQTWTTALAAPAPVREVWVAGSSSAWALAECAAAQDPTCRQLYRSTDGGASWTSMQTDLTSIAFADSTHGWGIVDSGPVKMTAVLRSTSDGGSTWADAPAPCDASPVGGLRAIAFDSATSGLAVCAETLGAGGEFHSVLATTDGGARWTVQASTGIPDPNGGSSSPAVGEIHYGGYIGRIVVAPDGTAWMTGGRMAPLVSRDRGATWLALGLGDPDGNLVQSAWPLTASSGFALMWSPDRQATLLEETTDGGRTWTERSASPAVSP